MKAGVLLQLNELTPLQKAVREHFQKGGSMLAMLLVLLGIAATLALAYWLTRRQRSTIRKAPPNDPRKLFRDLQEKLRLPVPQRNFLNGVALQLHLEHPSVLLLSPVLYDRYVDQWRANDRQRSGGGAPSKGSDVAAQTRAALFGEPQDR